MRATFPTLAALAAAGLLLGHQARRRHHPENPAGTGRPLDGHAHDAHGGTALALASVAALTAGGLLLSRRMHRTDGIGATVEESMELDVPVSTAYNQWTQFEEFPKFMASVEQVRQIDDTHLYWRAMVGGKVKEWDAEITEQIPDQRIAWRSIGGAPNGGVVTFNKLSEFRSRVVLQMYYQPETLGERLGDAVGAMKLTAKGNLKRFKKLMEQRGVETGAWRGEVTQH